MSSKSGKGQPRVSTKAQKGSSKRPGQQAPLQGGRDAALQWLCGVPSKKAPSAGEPAPSHAVKGCMQGFTGDYMLSCLSGRCADYCSKSSSEVWSWIQTTPRLISVLPPMPVSSAVKLSACMCPAFDL